MTCSEERNKTEDALALIAIIITGTTGEHRNGSVQGACMHDIFLHYLEAEPLADWDKARGEFGEDAAQCDLERTHGQRSADALARIYADAASNPNGPVPVDFVHNLVWNQETFEYFLDLYNGEDPEPLDPDLYRCETIDGIQINPIEAMASALVSKVRRVVLDGKGTIIDLGQTCQFTGNSRTAVKLSSKECIWPSCHVPTPDVRQITCSSIREKAEPTPEKGRHFAGNTIGGNKKVSPSTKTNSATGTPTDPMDLRSIPN